MKKKNPTPHGTFILIRGYNSLSENIYSGSKMELF